MLNDVACIYLHSEQFEGAAGVSTFIHRERNSHHHPVRFVVDERLRRGLNDVGAGVSIAVAASVEGPHDVSSLRIHHDVDLVFVGLAEEN